MVRTPCIQAASIKDPVKPSGNPLAKEFDRRAIGTRGLEFGVLLSALPAKSIFPSEKLGSRKPSEPQAP